MHHISNPVCVGRGDDLRSTKVDIALVRTPLRALMDDITVRVKSDNAAREIPTRLEEMITWSRMKFKAKMSKSYSFVKRNRKRSIFPSLETLYLP